jgi:hypothetical protein
MHITTLRLKGLAVIAALCLVFAAGCDNSSSEQQATDRTASSDLTGAAGDIINKYLQATQGHEDTLRGVTMQVDIDASVPKLKEQGKLKALRNISKVGVITYRVLSFQGDNTVKQQVIARFLSAEQQAQSDNKLAITPANYRFKYRGERQLATGGEVYVFQLAPRSKRVGLFKGEMWLDAHTYLPVYEKGRLVKNPSVFFRKVDFERAYSIRNGIAIPASVNSTIDTRLIGVVQLNVNYSNFEQNAVTDQADGGAESAAFVSGAS